MRLTEREEGLLLNLIEEANEVAQMAAKYLRFGSDSFNPEDPEETPNRILLAKEIGNLEHISLLMKREGFIDPGFVQRGRREKESRLEKYPLIVRQK